MWNFKLANFEHSRAQLSEIDWNAFFESEDINIVCDNITVCILTAAKSNIPNKTVTMRPADKGWYTNELRKLKRKMNDFLIR